MDPTLRTIALEDIEKYSELHASKFNNLYGPPRESSYACTKPSSEYTKLSPYIIDATFASSLKSTTLNTTHCFKW